MQPWDQVKVIKDKSEHLGRAGVVQAITGDTVEVKLDENDTHESGIELFAADDLQFLGR